jgi:hypothetical protein
VHNFAIRDTGVTMTAELILLDRYRPREPEPIDATDTLVFALGQYSSAELHELLYVGQEQGFFELMRGVFGLPEETRQVLLKFLTHALRQNTRGEIDEQGRLVLKHSPHK